jgi:hypothetical protein
MPERHDHRECRREWDDIRRIASGGTDARNSGMRFFDYWGPVTGRPTV